MNLKFYISIFFMAITSSVFSQGLEDDLSILYMKANVLFDSGRFDESVRMYNRILGDDDSYAAAYFMRGKAKFELGAYKGTKNDILDFIEINGVTKDVIKLMSKTEYKLENFEAAKNYVTTALELDPYDAEQYKIAGDVESAVGNKNEACEMWYSASELGDSKSKKLLDSNCGIYMKMKKENNERRRPSRNQESTDRVNNTEEDVVDLGEAMEDDMMENGGDTKVEAPDMDAINEIAIDDELSIVIGNGLGKRKVENQPDIFMLANESGRVVIDVCVNGRGKVVSAEINNGQTTINKGGLVSLAIRKSKEFSFFPSFRNEQCGQFIYMITGGQ